MGMAARRKAWLAAGKCRDCGADAVTKQHCERCRKAHNAAVSRRAAGKRERRMRAGKCRECGRPRINASHCAKHAEAARQRWYNAKVRGILGTKTEKRLDTLYRNRGETTDTELETRMAAKFKRMGWD